jgi:ribonuclease J
MNDNKDQVKIIPLGGVGDVTRNMYVYEYGQEMLIIDCGLGFADETMLGVDLMIPDISYIEGALKQGKKIVGMAITHGHEDHMGALPFILPQLPEFPIYATPLSAGLASHKLQEFGIARKVEGIPFEENRKIQIGSFSIQFIRVTHSVPDTSHIFISTPLGNFYHGSDFKIDPTPYDGKTTDIQKIQQLSQQGVVCLLSDCLGAEREGTTPTEASLSNFFVETMKKTTGKYVVTTYSSNINRINQVLTAAASLHKYVCFVGRSLINTVEVAKKMGLITIPQGMEIRADQVKQHKDNQVVLFVAGSQGQENSALTRIANGEHKDIKLSPADTVVFSSDPIPGNEIMVNSLIDELLRGGCEVIYSDIAHVHVSGHGSQDELTELIDLVHPQKLFPIGGNFKHMVAYQKLAVAKGYAKQDVLLPEDGQEMVFTRNGAHLGTGYPVKPVYVDEISGEEVEGYVLRDRQKLSQDGIVAIMAEVDANTGRLVDRPDIIIRGFSEKEVDDMKKALSQELQRNLSGKKGKVTNWVILRKMIGETAERRIYKEFRRRPLILPVVIEV